MMEPQTSPNTNNPRAVPPATSEPPANENANASGATPAVGSRAVDEQADIKLAIETKRLGDRFGLNYDLVLRNLDRLRQAAALEDVTVGEFRLPFGIGERGGAANGRPASSSQSASNDIAQNGGSSSQLNPAAQEGSDSNHHVKSGADAAAYTNATNSTPDIDSASQSSTNTEPEMVQNLTAEAAFDHYRKGSGTPLRMSLDQLDLSGVKPTDFPEFRSAIQRGVDTEIDTKAMFSMFTSSFNDYFLLGDSKVRMQGHLSFAKDGNWTFEGKYKVFDDPYDFNASTHRWPGGELLTTIGRHIKGTPFDIEIRGAKSFVAKGIKESEKNPFYYVR